MRRKGLLIRAEGVHTHWRYALLAHRLCGGIRVCAPECNFSGRKKYPAALARGIFILVFAVIFAGEVSAQDADIVHKHNPSDMLLGLNFGLGMTSNMSDLFSRSIPRGNYAIVFDFGLTYDFYLFNWLSFNTGLLLHPDIYLILDQTSFEVDSFTDIAAAPLCLTIPLAAHVNVPKVEWLYAGIGLSLNIPISSMLEGVISEEETGFDTKGDFFVGLPMDIGFDFVKPGKGGGRFFVRITPEFHKKGTAVPIGFIWQIHNWKIHSKTSGNL